MLVRVRVLTWEGGPNCEYIFEAAGTSDCTRARTGTHTREHTFSPSQRCQSARHAAPPWRQQGDHQGWQRRKSAGGRGGAGGLWAAWRTSCAWFFVCGLGSSGSTRCSEYEAGAYGVLRRQACGCTRTSNGQEAWSVEEASAFTIEKRELETQSHAGKFLC